MRFEPGISFFVGKWGTCMVTIPESLVALAQTTWPAPHHGSTDFLRKKSPFWPFFRPETVLFFSIGGGNNFFFFAFFDVSDHFKTFGRKKNFWTIFRKKWLFELSRAVDFFANFFSSIFDVFLMYFDVKSNSKNFFLLAKKKFFIFLFSYSAIYLEFSSFLPYFEVGSGGTTRASLAMWFEPGISFFVGKAGNHIWLQPAPLRGRKFRWPGSNHMVVLPRRKQEGSTDFLRKKVAILAI